MIRKFLTRMIAANPVRYVSNGVSVINKRCVVGVGIGGVKVRRFNNIIKMFENLPHNSNITWLKMRDSQPSYMILDFDNSTFNVHIVFDLKTSYIKYMVYDTRCTTKVVKYVFNVKIDLETLTIDQVLCALYVNIFRQFVNGRNVLDSNDNTLFFRYMRLIELYDVGMCWSSECTNTSDYKQAVGLKNSSKTTELYCKSASSSTSYSIQSTPSSSETNELIVLSAVKISTDVVRAKGCDVTYVYNRSMFIDRITVIENTDISLSHVTDPKSMEGLTVCVCTTW